MMNRKPQKIEIIEKEWLDYHDIVALYGQVDRKFLHKIRAKRLVTVSQHPLNSKSFIYSRRDLEQLVEKNKVVRKEI